MDYCFATAEEKDDNMGATLVMYDHKMKSLWAIQVEHKGAVDYVVKWCLNKFEESGYLGSRITLKSDQEPSMVALKDAIAAARVGDTAFIESPVRESKSNGAAERAIRTWEGMMRTWKHFLEAKLKLKIPGNHALMG